MSLWMDADQIGHAFIFCITFSLDDNVFVKYVFQLTEGLTFRFLDIRKVLALEIPLTWQTRHIVVISDEHDWIWDQGVSMCRFIKYELAALSDFMVFLMTFRYKDMWSLSGPSTKRGKASECRAPRDPFITWEYSTLKVSFWSKAIYISSLNYHHCNVSVLIASLQCPHVLVLRKDSTIFSASKGLLCALTEKSLLLFLRLD